MENLIDIIEIEKEPKLPKEKKEKTIKEKKVKIKKEKFKKDKKINYKKLFKLLSIYSITIFTFITTLSFNFLFIWLTIPVTLIFLTSITIYEIIEDSKK